MLDLLAKYKVSWLYLALCLRLLIPEFEGAYPERTINVHRSFLPAFVGADPYRPGPAGVG